MAFLRDQGLLKGAGLAKQHFQGLEDIARILRRSGEIQKNDPLTKAMKLLKLTRGITSAGTGSGVSALLGKMLTDADAADRIAKALKSSSIPATAANIYCGATSLSGPSATQ